MIRWHDNKIHSAFVDPARVVGLSDHFRQEPTLYVLGRHRAAVKVHMPNTTAYTSSGT